MNWRVGFMRLWIVMSALWVITIGTYMYNALFGAHSPQLDVEYVAVERPPYAISTFSLTSSDVKGVGSIAHATVQLRDVRGRLYYRENILPETLEAAKAAMRDGIEDYQRDYDDQRNANAPFAVGAILLPPILLLLIGTVVSWVAIGFRRKVA